MDALQFAYWLNGFAELTGDEPPTDGQWTSIKEHLALVFTKVTPPVPSQDQAIQDQLRLAAQPYHPNWIGNPIYTGTPAMPPLRATCQTAAADPNASKVHSTCNTEPRDLTEMAAAARQYSAGVGQFPRDMKEVADLNNACQIMWTEAERAHAAKYASRNPTDVDGYENGN